MDPEETVETTTPQQPAPQQPKPAATQTQQTPAPGQQPAARRAPHLGDDLDDRDRDHQYAISDVKERERRRLWREEYGTTDPDEVAKKKQERAAEAERLRKNEEELAQLRKEKADRDRASMSEVERLNADIKTLTEENRQLKEQLSRTQQEAMSERQNAAIQACAIRHKVKNKPSVLRVVMQDYAAAFLAMSNIERKALNDRVKAERHLDRFMKKWAEENEDMVEKEAPAAKETKDPAASRPKPTIVRQPLGAPRRPTTTPARPTTTSVLRPGFDENGKTVKPGLPNSMNAQELAAYKRKHGLRA